MTEPIDFVTPVHDQEAQTGNLDTGTTPAKAPSNEVHARVGDMVLRAAQSGVRRGMRPEDIIREIVTEYNVRLNLGEFRLLLATRRLPDKPTRSQ